MKQYTFDDWLRRIDAPEPARRQPKKTEEAKEEAEGNALGLVDLKAADRLRKAGATALEQAEAKMNPATAQQRPTARRLRIIDGMRQEGLTLRRIGLACQLLADRWKTGTVPAELRELKTRKAIAEAISPFAPPELRTALIDLLQEMPEREAGPAERAADLKRKLFGVKIDGFFPTPGPVIETLLDYAEIDDGMSVCEPSAGWGSIAEVIRSRYRVQLEVIERAPRLREILDILGFALVADNVFEHTRTPGYDRVVANPPFERGQDAEHVQYYYEELLAPGGILVAVMGEGVFFRSDAKSKRFREWFNEQGGRSERLPEQSFMAGEAGDRWTSVNTRIVVLKKPAEPQLTISYGSAPVASRSL